jgi:hypothetical protein
MSLQFMHALVGGKRVNSDMTIGLVVSSTVYVWYLAALWHNQSGCMGHRDRSKCAAVTTK